MTGDPVSSSVLLRRLDRVRRTVARWWAGSSLVRLADRTGSTVGRWIRGSRLHRWLTAEPDPQVIVVDLRETYTVGPVVAALDRVGGWLAPRWRASRPRRALAAGVETFAAAPVRLAGLFAVVAICASLVRTLAGAPTEIAVGAHLLALAPALVGVRERRSWADLRESRVGRALSAALAPPDPDG
ncbi:hypothetical protein ACFQPA_15440 [Halomarina halobia]|uniref:Uncharacterized protein n=1 Tax=Halomarina halobia TaxID=3033386 RepID=A0ABD6A8R5_9EURY|nr:hypothetical protein [Halomarina sp. PSR21]